MAEFLKWTQYGISVEEILYGMYYVKIIDYTTDTCQGDKLSTITALMETDIDKIVNRLSSSNIPPNWYQLLYQCTYHRQYKIGWDWIKVRFQYRLPGV